MNYLAKHLNNSLELPYDIMNLIYEYADPFIYVRKQIQNKEYDLDKIMYNRMKNIIINKPLVYNYAIDMINLTILDMYKSYFLIEYPKICGLNHPNLAYRKFLMICDLRHAKIYKSTNTNYDKYKMKNVYKKWLKL
jgi:hypothetical protein